MPTPLPPAADLAGSGSIPTSDVFRAAIGNVRAFLAEKLGTSGTNSDAQTALGAGTAGKAVFAAATVDDAQSALGAGASGKAVFATADELALAKLIGAGSIAADLAKLKVLLGINHQIQMGSSVVTTDASGLATITFPEQFLAKNGPSLAPEFAIVALGDTTSMSPIAAVQASYTSTTMQIKCAASVTIRVNWCAVALYPIII